MNKIFFLTPYYYDLHKPIVAELEKQGYQVHVEEDVRLTGTLRHKKTSLLKRISLQLYRFLTSNVKRHWSYQIKLNPSFSDKYIYFLCINGESFHPILLNHLKKNNPQIKSVLYIWDSSKFFDFYHYKNNFDKVFTFDSQDAEFIPGVSFLPSYWCLSIEQPVKYHLFIIGSDHDDRIQIVSKVYNQLENNGITSFLKVVLRKPAPPSGWKRLFGYYAKRYEQNCCIFDEKIKLPYTTTDYYPPMQVMDLIAASNCILDTNIPGQSGVSQRVIWALARGKKIITTNNDIIKSPFYRSDQILIIDRENPIIDIDFVKKPSEFDVNPYIINLRIDNWVRRLLD